MITMNRRLLSGTPEDVRCTMEDLARDQDDHEYLDGARFRQLAVQLATRDGLAHRGTPSLSQSTSRHVRTCPRRSRVKFIRV
jgi:hypothetical protein